MSDPTNADSSVLTEERIAAMRRTVLAETRQRPRRRWLAPVAAAAVLVVGVGVAGQVLQSSDSMSEDSVAGATELRVDTGRADGEHADRQVITTGSVLVTVTSVESAVRSIEDFVAERDGRIDSRSQYRSGEFSPGFDADSPATLVVRIEPREVDALIQEVRRLGTVEELEISREDVTTQVTDLDARIRSLEVSIARLEAIMAESTSTRDLLEAETQLSQRQGELESLQAQRRQVGSQVELASIVVTLRGAGDPSAVDPGGFRGGLVDGWNALVGLVNGLLVGAGVLAVWLVPVAFVALLGRFVWRRVSRRGRAAGPDRP